MSFAFILVCYSYNVKASQHKQKYNYTYHAHFLLLRLDLLRVTRHPGQQAVMESTNHTNCNNLIVLSIKSAIQPTNFK